MLYLISVLDNRTASGTEAEFAAVEAFNAKVKTEGYWVYAGGLDAPSKAIVIDNRGAQPEVTVGPYVETREHVAGFWIFDVPYRDTAVQLAIEGSKACNRRVELRPML